MPDVVRPCVLSKDSDGMPRPTLPTVRAFQGRLCHATPDIIRPSVQSKGRDIMPRPTLFDCVCCPTAMMACHTRCRFT